MPVAFMFICFNLSWYQEIIVFGSLELERVSVLEVLVVTLEPGYINESREFWAFGPGVGIDVGLEVGVAVGLIDADGLGDKPGAVVACVSSDKTSGACTSVVRRDLVPTLLK